LINYYRTRHGVWASIGYFFNHDSPRRSDDYFLPRLVAQLAAHLQRRVEPPPLWTLDFWCDWGAAPEFMNSIASLLELNEPNDVVMASGVPTYAAALAEALSEAGGVDRGAWARTKKPASPAQAPGMPAFRAKLDHLRSLVDAPQSDGLDVALWILRERHGIDLPRAPSPD
jgi:GDPmannose 4,6-dehydratase